MLVFLLSLVWGWRTAMFQLYFYGVDYPIYFLDPPRGLGEGGRQPSRAP